MHFFFIILNRYRESIVLRYFSKHRDCGDRANGEINNIAEPLSNTCELYLINVSLSSRDIVCSGSVKRKLPILLTSKIFASDKKLLFFNWKHLGFKTFKHSLITSTCLKKCFVYNKQKLISNLLQCLCRVQMLILSWQTAFACHNWTHLHH